MNEGVFMQRPGNGWYCRGRAKLAAILEAFLFSYPERDDQVWIVVTVYDGIRKHQHGGYTGFLE